MNEELQSTNEELQTMNDELRNRSTELNASNAFLEAVFTSLRAAVVVVDRELRVQVVECGRAGHVGPARRGGAGDGVLQSRRRVAGRRAAPAGSRHPVRDVAAHREVVLPATNRKGRRIQCRVSVVAAQGRQSDVTGAIILMEEDVEAVGLVVLISTSVGIARTRPGSCAASSGTE